MEAIFSKSVEIRRSSVALVPGIVLQWKTGLGMWLSGFAKGEESHETHRRIDFKKAIWGGWPRAGFPEK